MYGGFQAKTVRRRRNAKRDEGQSSLDAFSADAHKGTSSSTTAAIPPMVDLDRLEAAQHQLEGEANVQHGSVEGDGPREFAMPSLSGEVRPNAPVTSTITFHDLERQYPSAPVPAMASGTVIHYATLSDLTGCDTVMNWVADGHAVLIDMQRLMARHTEFTQTLKRLQEFVEGDLNGTILKMNETRVMCLPEQCRGVRGTEMEAFAGEQHDDVGVFE